MKPYPVYRPSGFEWLGDVPQHWGVLPTKHANRIVMGQSPPSDTYQDEPVERPFLQGNAEFGPHSPTPKWYCDAAPKVVDAGTLLLSVRAPVGALNVADQTLGIGRGLCGIVPDPPYVDPRFAWWTLHVTRRALESIAAGSTYDAVSAEQVGLLPFPFPPFDEQRAIAEYLDRETERIDALAAKMRLLIERLQEYRSALLARTVTRGLPSDAARAAGLDPSPRLKPSGIEWLGDVPENWEVIENRRLFRERDERSQDGEGELLTVSHITGVTRRSEKPGVGMFMAESLEGYKTCYTGDFVINTMWAWMGATGTSREAGLVSPSYNVYTPDPRRLHQRFVDLAYRSARYVLGMTSESRGIWTSRLRLYPQQFLSLVTAIPPMEEQQAIISHVDQIESESLRIIEAVEAAIERLQEYRTALITAAVTGKVDVREPVAAEGS